MDYLHYLNLKMASFLVNAKISIYDIKIKSINNIDYLVIELFKKNNYIHIEECTSFHQQANMILSNDSKLNAHISEVMSVGVNTLVNNDYQLALITNLVISCKLITSIDNFHIIDGTLIKFDDQFIYLSNKQKPEIKINRNTIREIKIDK